MTRQHWTLEDIHWDRFDPSKVDPLLLTVVKAASMVEFNAPDYVTYLRGVFAGDVKTLELFEQWGAEETQHGQALARWAELADPNFKFNEAFAAFTSLYRPTHFDSGEHKRGGRIGEMIARCVVESGTSSYYSALRDATDEPVLKQIAANIAADEFRHWKLFYETMQEQNEKPLSFWQRLAVAAGRVNEAEDDELATAYFCASTPIDQIKATKYDRRTLTRLYQSRVRGMYRERHIHKAMQMIAKAIGVHPQGLLPRFASRFLWFYLQAQARFGTKAAA
jgi:rubrerythrin